MIVLNDLKIIAAIKDKDETAINELIDKYSKLLWKIAAKTISSIGTVEDIEECVADAFIYLWEKPQKFDYSKGTLKTYLSVITKTKAIDRCRKILKNSFISLDDSFLVNEFSNTILNEESHIELKEAIKTLEEPQYEILIRRYFYQQKPKEIAKVLKMNVKQVNNHLYQAKQKLRKIITL